MIILRNGRIWDGEKFFDGSVAIEDGQISQIGEIHGKAELEFDAAGKIISAELVDIHTHLRGVSCAGFGVNGESVEYSGCDFSFKDKAGNILQRDSGYRCLLTIADGQIVHCNAELEEHV